jgi:hypothetical protein
MRTLQEILERLERIERVLGVYAATTVAAEIVEAGAGPGDEAIMPSDVAAGAGPGDEAVMPSDVAAGAGWPRAGLRDIPAAKGGAAKLKRTR